MIMPTTTLSRKVKNTNHFITIPRTEYEELLVFKTIFPVVEPSAQELRAIRQGRKEIAAGNYTSWQEVKHKLANRHSKPRGKRYAYSTNYSPIRDS